MVLVALFSFLIPTPIVKPGCSITTDSTDRLYIRDIQDRSYIEQGHISSASCILANMSMKLGRSLKWDAAAGKVVGDEEANRLLSRPYRAPWTHPQPA